MDFIWILFAFMCGFAARYLALPPLVGYLFAGFLLHFLGVKEDASLQILSDLGITLMLFTIGLKLRINALLKLEVFGTALLHMGSWALLSVLLLLGLSTLGVSMFAGMELQTMALVGFALSFSSTVCAFKILEDSGELKTRHGSVVIGVLVLQDVVAVVFMVFATGVIPSIWALALLALWFIRPLLGKLLEKAGHGELLPLLGFFLAVGGYELFYLVDLKGDLGALVIGALLSNHGKATELYKSLMSFKDLFLIGFFLSIGFTALPDHNMLMLASLIALLLPLKSALFFGLFTGFKVRARKAFLSSLLLSNYSEFGLIVAALAVELGWLNNEWLVILALSVSLSFLFTSLLYRSAHILYARWKNPLQRLESIRQPPMTSTTQVMPEVDILIVGMGRVGKATYQSLTERVDHRVGGMDADETRVAALSENGMNVFYGDGEDASLWERMNLSNIKLVLIALPYIQDIRNICAQLKLARYSGKVAAFARYEDQIDQLEEAGIDKIFNFYDEVGVGFAREGVALVEKG